MTALVQSRRTRGVDVLVLDSPTNRNAMSVQLLQELLAGVEASAAGPGRGLLLDHTGSVFCAGVDLRERRALGADDSTHSTLLARLLRDLWSYPKPVLCRVDGAARGGGMGLVACADLVVASARASFAYSEVKVGVAPALVMAVALPKVPAGSLLPWLLTGDTFDASIGHRIGLVTRVADDDACALDPEVEALLQAAPGAVSVVKQLVRQQQGVDVETLLDSMQEQSAMLFRSDEAKEGMSAFVERRRPAWAPPV